MSERIQKVLARAGHGSRREIEDWISTGRIRVNNRSAQLGDRIDAGDRVLLDGRPLRVPDEEVARRVIAYHKPVGEVSTRSDPEGRPTVFDALPPLRGSRWLSIGRLDINTAGLLLFTTDGDLAHKLMHPSGKIVREYAVRVFGEVSDDHQKALLAGVTLDDGPARFDSLRVGGATGRNHWYHVTLREGRKREVRRLFEAVGLKVNRLLRVAYGPVRLEARLRPGRWRDLAPAEVRALAGELTPARRRKVRGRRNKKRAH